VSKLLEMHGGSIEARSDGAGKGSVFTIRLPRVARPATSPSEEMSRRKVQPRRVLIVEDNVDAANSLAALLKADNHDIHVAHSGAEALARVEGFKPDVALVDLNMPGMSGYELARQLRAMPLNGMRLVALTGNGQPEDRARTEEAGFDDHLIKPVEPSILERT